MRRAIPSRARPPSLWPPNISGGRPIFRESAPRRAGDCLGHRVWGAREDTVTVPLACALYTPKTSLQPGDVLQTTPQLAPALIEQLLACGLAVEVVLADTL